MSYSKYSFKHHCFDIVKKCSCKENINKDICDYLSSIPEFKELYDNLTTNVESSDNINDYEKMLLILLCEIKGFLSTSYRNYRKITGENDYLYKSCLAHSGWTKEIMLNYRENKSKYLHYDYTKREWFSQKCPNERIIKYIEEEVERCGVDDYYVQKNEYKTIENCRVSSILIGLKITSFVTFLLNVLTEPKLLYYFKLFKKDSKIYQNLRHIFCICNETISDCNFDDKCCCDGSLQNKLFTLLESRYLKDLFALQDTYKDFNFYYSKLFN